MKITSTQYAQALFDAVSETALHDHDKVLDNFVKILAQNGDLGKYEEIDNEFRKLKLESQGIKEVEVTVAKEVEMNHKLIDELNAVVGAGLGRPISVDGRASSFAKATADESSAPTKATIEIKQIIDESIIGGVVVRVDDTLIDASVKTQLNNLNKNLRS